MGRKFWPSGWRCSKAIGLEGSRLRRVRAKRLAIEDDTLIIVRFFGAASRVDITDIKSISAGPVPSLINEIGVWVTTDDTVYSFVDSDEGFSSVAERINLNELFGEYWYVRAEEGETFTFSGRIP